MVAFWIDGLGWNIFDWCYDSNDWVQGLSLPIDGSRDIPNANYKIRKKSNEGYQYRHRDWIDSGSFWNVTMV